VQPYGRLLTEAKAESALNRQWAVVHFVVQLSREGPTRSVARRDRCPSSTLLGSQQAKVRSYELVPTFVRQPPLGFSLVHVAIIAGRPSCLRYECLVGLPGLIDA
jgi:hypothetical protein